MPWATRLLRHAARHGCLLVAALGAGCATTPSGAPEPIDARGGVDGIDADGLRAVGVGADGGGRDARTITPPPRKPIAIHAKCGARVELVRASPIGFEGTLLRTLYDVELTAAGPAGLVVALDGDGPPTFADVALPPKVALRLPAGPAQDGPAGASGALFDLGGLAVAGLVNLTLFPVTIPLGILAGRPDAFLMDAPTFTDGMFSDIVLDQATWDAEVARRAAPHQAALATEAERQQRFATWKGGLVLEQQQLSCTVDGTGRCTLHVLWPRAHLEPSFTALECAAPPPETTGGEPAGTPPPLPQVTWLPTLPEPKAPVALAVPPRPPDDRRGEGAHATLDAWSDAADVALEDDDARARWSRAKQARRARGEPLTDATLVCRITARGSFDIDDSAPELRVRLAFGFDGSVAGRSFPSVQAHQRTVGLKHVTLLPGELVKLSLVDIDALVDDWIGMDVVTFDGALPLRFEHPSFTAQCGAADAPIER